MGRVCWDNPIINNKYMSSIPRYFTNWIALDLDHYTRVNWYVMIHQESPAPALAGSVYRIETLPAGSNIQP
jgi:hypothetical protein